MRLGGCVVCVAILIFHIKLVFNSSLTVHRCLLSVHNLKGSTPTAFVPNIDVKVLTEDIFTCERLLNYSIFFPSDM